MYAQRLEFIVTLREKLEPGYLLSAHDSVPYSSLSQKSSCRDFNLLWQTVKSDSQIICDLLLSAFCSVLPQKSRGSACTQRFKPIVAHSENLLQGDLPSVHTSVPAVELLSVAPSWPFVLEEAKHSSKCTLGRGVIPSSATQ